MRFSGGGGGGQPPDTDLDAVAGLTTTGVVVRTGSGTATTRTLTAGSTRVTVTNGDGVAGAPTVDVPAADGSTVGVAKLGATGGSLPYDSTTAYTRTLLDDANAATARATLELTVGTHVQAWDTDLDGYAALATTGLVARTGSGTAAARTLTAGSAQLTVANGDGVAGNPTVDLAYASAVRETGTPATLSMGAVPDGTYLKRSGSTIVGVSLAFAVAVSVPDTGASPMVVEMMLEFAPIAAYTGNVSSYDGSVA